MTFLETTVSAYEQQSRCISIIPSLRSTLCVIQHELSFQHVVENQGSPLSKSLLHCWHPIGSTKLAVCGVLHLAKCNRSHIRIDIARWCVVLVVLQACMPLLVYLVGAAFGTEQLHCKTLLNLLVVVLGILMASYGKQVKECMHSTAV